MLRYLLLACFITVGLCQQPDIAILEERMPNGDENEIVSIDLKKHDGTGEISVVAQLRFHLNQSQVYVNKHPVIHKIVNSVRMRVSIIEIKGGIKMTPRLAPVTFRVLVTENTGDNGNKKLIAEVEFVEVERYEVLQVDVKQIIWEGSNRHPVTSISLQDSIIHHEPQDQDKRIFVTDPEFKPRLPSHGLKADESLLEDLYYDHHHQSKVLCWFSQLSFAGKIAVICTSALIFIGLVLSLIMCCKRLSYRKKLNVLVPIDNFVEVKGCDMDKKNMADLQMDGDFHMEVNECFVDIDDKKALVE